VGELCRLEDNVSYGLHKTYCPKCAGSIFTFGVKGGYEAGKSMVNNVKLFSHLANIGDTRSLIIHPASTTHRQLETRSARSRRRWRRRRAPLDRHRECRRNSLRIWIRP